MASQAALAEVFRHVRARIPRLGVGEYVALLRALEGGYGAGTRGLVLLCQALWAKSPAEERQVAQVVEALLPKRSADDDALPPPAPEPGMRPPLTPEWTPAPQVRPAPRPAADAERGEAAGVADGRAVRVDAAASGGGASDVVDLLTTSPFDLEGSLPVTRRQMSRAWRFYRRMGRRGVPVEVDAEATIRRIYRDGVLAAPVLVPRRTNQARALILEDTGGSMVPFRYVSEELIHAARHAGLARVDVFHFHDVAVDVVFRDSALRAPVTLEDAVGRFAEAGVLIYSDAGAARGGRDAERVRRTAAMLNVLSRATQNVAWLNPVPEARWRRTTAEMIAFRVPMFPLDREGLQKAVDHMRGAR
ncbi:MAG TPA: VWA domain-containing protein [Longimicrobium sp.]|nr:VWA domain-containing protein [Longimicrobium sp.]